MIRVKKKILLVGIVLLMILVGFNSASSKAFKFGDWDKWEEILPPWDDDNWQIEGKEGEIVGIPFLINIVDQANGNKHPVFTTTQFNYGSGKSNLIVLLFSPYIASEAITDQNAFKIKDKIYVKPDFAVVVSYDGKVFNMLGYQRQEEKLVFSEKWTIKPPNKDTIIFNKKSDYYKKITEWIDNLMITKNVLFNKEKIDNLFPHLKREGIGYQLFMVKTWK